MSTRSVDVEVIQAVNRIAAAYGYSCVPVGWEDVLRFKDSIVGRNYTDVTQEQRGAKVLFVCRKNNYADPVSATSTDQVAAIITDNGARKSVTLRDYLKNIDSYSGLPKHAFGDMSSSLDDVVSIRFQVVFLVIPESDSAIEICTQTCNYNTHSNTEPANMEILCTPQGTFVHTAEVSKHAVYPYVIDAAGELHRHWFEAEVSKIKVGASQVETEAEQKEAIARGKSIAVHMGTPQMDARFNVQMLIQVPLQRSEPTRSMFMTKAYSGTVLQSMSCGGPMLKSMSYAADAEEESDCDMGYGLFDGDELESCAMDDGDMGFGAFDECATYADPRCAVAATAPKAVAQTTCARMSIGTVIDEDKFTPWAGPAATKCVRHESEHITVTVTMYYAVKGGIPSEADVKTAIADLEANHNAYRNIKSIHAHPEFSTSTTTTTMTATDVTDVMLAKCNTTSPFS